MSTVNCLLSPDMRIVFMGTPVFAVPTLAALHKAGHEIVAVYSQPPRPAGRGQKDTPSPVHQYANANNIPVFTPASLKDEDVQKTFAAHKADIAVVVAYGLLLPKPILEAYPMGCINVHPSLLPCWRGAAPIQRTIMAGDTMTGICIMQMDEGMDTGDVLRVEEGFSTEGLNAGDLHNILSEEAAPLVLMTLEELKEGNITPRKQPEEGVTYAKKITKEECRIDWTKPAEEIANQIRGLAPSPGAYFIYGGEHIKIFSATTDGLSDKKAGTLVNDQLAISCGNGVIQPAELQRPGKKRLPLKEFLAGFSFNVGDMVS